MMRNLIFTAAALMVVTVAAPATAQKSEGTVRTAFSAPMEGLDWYHGPGNERHLTSHALFDTLIVADENTGKFVPLLAKSFKRVDNVTTEFVLHEGVKWHDGEAFDADDVVATIKFLTDPKTRIRFKRFYAWIKSVEKTGSHTVRLVSKRPTASDLATLAFVTWIYPEHAFARLADKKDFQWKPVGTGPYKLAKGNTSVADLVQNTTYRHGGSGKPATNVKRILISAIPDPATQTAQMLTGRLDYVRSSVDHGKSLAANTKFGLTVKQGVSLIYMGIDAKGRSGNKPLTDVRVRRALQMGINRKELVLVTTGDPNFKRVPKAMCWDNQAGCGYSAKLPEYDPVAAKKLLAEAGYADGLEVEITAFATSDASRSSAEVIASQWAKIGVKAKIDPRTITSYRKKQRDGKIQVCICPYGGGGFLSDIAGMISFIYAPPKSRDYHGDETLKKMSRATSSIMDPAKRQAAARKVFDLAQNQGYFMPLAPSPAVLVHDKDLVIKSGGLSTPYGLSVNQLSWKE